LCPSGKPERVYWCLRLWVHRVRPHGAAEKAQALRVGMGIPSHQGMGWVEGARAVLHPVEGVGVRDVVHEERPCGGGGGG